MTPTFTVSAPVSVSLSLNLFTYKRISMLTSGHMWAFKIINNIYEQRQLANIPEVPMEM